MRFQPPSIEHIAAAEVLSDDERKAALARFNARFGHQAGVTALSELERIAVVLRKDTEDLTVWRSNLAKLRDADSVSPAP